jgi:hypothetical protein
MFLFSNSEGIGMRFSGSVDTAGEKPPAGEYVALVVEAAEKPAPWGGDSLALTLEVIVDGRPVTFDDFTGIESESRLAVICRSCGVPPVGDVDAEALVGRRVGVEVRHKLTKSGREIATVGRWFEPPPPKVETRPAARNVVRNPEQGGGGRDDVSF